MLVSLKEVKKFHLTLYKQFRDLDVYAFNSDENPVPLVLSPKIYTRGVRFLCSRRWRQKWSIKQRNF